MSELNGESETKEAVVLISLVALDTDSVKTAKKLRLEIDGDAYVIMTFAELNVKYLHAIGSQYGLVDGEGNPIGPKKIDPLAGDDPVAE